MDTSTASVARTYPSLSAFQLAELDHVLGDANEARGMQGEGKVHQQKANAIGTG